MSDFQKLATARPRRRPVGRPPHCNASRFPALTQLRTKELGMSRAQFAAALSALTEGETFTAELIRRIEEVGQRPSASFKRALEKLTNLRPRSIERLLRRVA